jgi:DNA polymerase-3 subunit epsilon
MIREIALDTETTGLSPREGDRVVEIGCVEMINRMPSGRNFHVYINPQRDMPQEAFNVHGLSSDFLADKPLFAAVVAEFLEFVAGDPLVIHNAAFDIGFLNHELGLAGHPALSNDRVIDSLMLARRRHPGGKNTLDALCSRYGIDRSRRVKHGALLDAEILAEVYAELAGGRQAALGLAVIAEPEARQSRKGQAAAQRPVPLAACLSDAERQAHAAFIETIGDKAIWNQYLTPN